MAPRSFAQKIWYRVAKSMVRIFVSIAFRARYSGQANVPRKGGALLVANHQSHLDPPIIGAGCPRQMSYLARLTLFRFSPFGWLLQSVGGIPIDRDGSALAGIRATLEALQRGEMVLVFPEGTRSRDGDLGVFKPGLALVARRAKVPIVPAAIEGAFRAWPRAAALPQFRIVHVHYGTPLLPEQIASCSEEELAALVQQRVRQCLELLRTRPEFALRTKEVARRAEGA
jgi:1-acyl-sn-glycerol-3-phosphate acyltransferase